MRAEMNNIADAIKQSVALLRRHLDWDNALARLADLNTKAEDPDLWNDTTNAREVMQQRDDLDGRIANVRRIEQTLADNIELIELGEEEGDQSIVDEAEAAIQKLGKEAAKFELETLLSGEADSNDAYLEVHAGAGGTESQDWCNMLTRMYIRWAERRQFKVEILEENQGDEAGLKSAVLLIKGHNAYGWAKTESGVHRLVRISPFDSNARRHTSFASVWVYPSIDENIEVEVNESDCRIDTYRASGAGGQHVNTTDSAVRITHQPTGIVVQCQNERSQHKNRATAWSMLRARLYEQELQKREEAAAEQAASKTDIGWGHQIRSYVLQPYQLVKDLRTGVESTNPSAVLDGDIDQFVEASLAHRVHGSEGEQVSDLE
ncbi:MAG: peptide chain release factor 2 [Hyphomicrobiales bacterium]|nr:peptide chain release factor 2 [Hyphomicrobiales bacterium]